jgi:hypothetical protein
MFGIHTRRRHRAAIEPLGRALAHVQQQQDFHDAGLPRAEVGLANALRCLVKACQEFLADPVMAEHLPENKSTRAGSGRSYLVGAKQTGSTQQMSRAREPMFKSKAEGEADFQAMCRANEAKMNGRPGELPAAYGFSGGDKLKAVMTRDLEPAAPASANPGVALLNKAMGVAL